MVNLLVDGSISLPLNDEPTPPVAVLRCATMAHVNIRGRDWSRP